MTTDEYERQHEQKPPQHQGRQPGYEHEMEPRPVVIRDGYRGSGRLEGKRALITGGDSGIGRSVAVHFAREGADVAFSYLDEHADAEETERMVREEGRQCLRLAGDVGDEAFCNQTVEQTLAQFGGLDILVNNAAEQHVHGSIEEVSAAQVERTFQTNIFSYFHMVRAAARHLDATGGVIVNTTSVNAYRGSGHLIDYSATKGAIVALTRSLANSMADRGVRVTGVAPGPIWTPLIPATFPEEAVQMFGEKPPMSRMGQPAEVAPCYVFLASPDASFMTGQILHPNGGDFTST